MSFVDLFKLNNKNNPNMRVFFNTATCTRITADNAEIKNIDISNITIETADIKDLKCSHIIADTAEIKEIECPYITSNISEIETALCTHITADNAEIGDITCNIIIANTAEIKDLSFENIITNDVTAHNYYVKLNNNQIQENTYYMMEKNTISYSLMPIMINPNTVYSIQGTNTGNNAIYLKLYDMYEYTAYFSLITTEANNIYYEMKCADTLMPGGFILVDDVSYPVLIEYIFMYSIINISGNTCNINYIQKITATTGTPGGVGSKVSTVSAINRLITGIQNNTMTLDLRASVSRIPTNNLYKLNYIYIRK